jgi:hypothetical protein
MMAWSTWQQPAPQEQQTPQQARLLLHNRLPYLKAEHTRTVILKGPAQRSRPLLLPEA